MGSNPGAQPSRLRVWLNSIQVHLFALSVGVVCALTVLSLTILAILDLPPEARPVRVYEMARLLQGKPLASSPGHLVYSRQTHPPAQSPTELERVLAMQLARRLGKAQADVRISVAGMQEVTNRVKQEVALYGPDRAADPVVWTTFSIAERQGGAWQVITRPTPDRAWRPSLWYTLILGFLLILPLTFWFGARFSRPIKNLAFAAQKMRGNQVVQPIALVGPSEIRLAAQSLNEMHARISRYVQERTTLTAAIAHDLRAPLSRLHFHLAVAPRPVREAAEGEIQEMERMIETILAFVEDELRPLDCEPIDLTLLVEGAADDFADRGHDVRVVVAEPITTLGDPVLLKRMLVNLVVNAVKFSGAVRIAIARDGANAVITVDDDGPGMGPEELARAFDPFFRGEPSRNRNTGGVGLGLSIAKSAAVAHGGTIHLANRAAGGLTATVVLPLAEVG